MQRTLQRSCEYLARVQCATLMHMSHDSRAIMREEITKTRDAIDGIVFA